MKLPERKKIRLNGYDYSSCNAYSVTVCTKRGISLWQSDEPVFSEQGEVVKTAIEAIENHYEHVKVLRYNIMSDHVHILLSIVSEDGIQPPNTKSISIVIGQMKRWVSKQLGFSIWQKSFYDRIIRNEQQYLNAWNYIEFNHKK